MLDRSQPASAGSGGLEALPPERVQDEEAGAGRQEDTEIMADLHQ